MPSLNNTRARVAAAALFAAVAVGAAALFTGGGDDPRRVWAAAADEVCAAFNEEVSAAARIDPSKPDTLRDWAAFAADRTDALAEDLSRLDASGAAAPLAELVVDEAAGRAEQYAQLAALDDAELTEMLGGGVGPGSKIADSYAKVAAAVEPWDGRSCAQSPLADPQVTPEWAARVEEWAASVEGACIEALGSMADVDRAAGAGELDRGGYLAAVAEHAGALAETLEALDDPPAGLGDDLTPLIGAISAVADHAAAADTAATRAANTEWVEVGAELGLGACAQGVPASPTTPSGYVAAPNLAPPEEGVEDGQLVDAEAVGGYAAAHAFRSAGVDPSENFGLAAALAAASGLEVVTGDQPASPTEISLSAPRLVDPDAEPGPRNPWVVGAAFTDIEGRCTHTHMFGSSRLVGYEVLAGEGPCTGDVAAARFVLDPAADLG